MNRGLGADGCTRRDSQECGPELQQLVRFVAGAGRRRRNETIIESETLNQRGSEGATGAAWGCGRSIAVLKRLTWSAIHSMVSSGLARGMASDLGRKNPTPATELSAACCSHIQYAMSGPYTLRQLSFANNPVYAVCGHCGHFSSVDLVAVAKTCGEWDAQVASVQQRMRCQKCKQKRCRLTTDRPTVGEQVCPRCEQPTWRRTPISKS